MNARLVGNDEGRGDPCLCTLGHSIRCDSWEIASRLSAIRVKCAKRTICNLPGRGHLGEQPEIWSQDLMNGVQEVVGSNPASPKPKPRTEANFRRGFSITHRVVNFHSRLVAASFFRGDRSPRDNSGFPVVITSSGDPIYARSFPGPQALVP